VRFQVTRVMDAIEQRLTTDVTLAQAVVDLGQVVRCFALDEGRPVSLVRIGMVIDALSRHLVDGGAMLYGVVDRPLLSESALTSKERMVLGRWADDGLIEVVQVIGDRVVEIADMTGLPVIAVPSQPARAGLPYQDLVGRYGWLAGGTGRVLRLDHRAGVAMLTSLPDSDTADTCDPVIGRAKVPEPLDATAEPAQPEPDASTVPSTDAPPDAQDGTEADDPPDEADANAEDRDEARAQPEIDAITDVESAEPPPEAGTNDTPPVQLAQDAPDDTGADAGEEVTARTEDARTEDARTEDVRTEDDPEARTEDVRTGDARTGDVRTEDDPEARTDAQTGPGGRPDDGAPAEVVPDTDSGERAGPADTDRAEPDPVDTAGPAGNGRVPLPVAAFANRAVLSVVRTRISWRRFRRAEPNGAHAKLLGRQWRCDEFECPVFGEHRRTGQPVPRLRNGVPVCPRHDRPVVDIGPRVPSYPVSIVVDDLPRRRLVVRGGRPVLVGSAAADPDDPDLVSLAQWLHHAAAVWICPRHVRLEVGEAGLVLTDLSEHGTVVWRRTGPDDPGKARLLRGESHRLAEWDSVELYTGIELMRGDRRLAAVLGRDDLTSVLLDAPTAAHHNVSEVSPSRRVSA
jgi:hypothetical protein